MHGFGGGRGSECCSYLIIFFFIIINSIIHEVDIWTILIASKFKQSSLLPGSSWCAQYPWLSRKHISMFILSKNYTILNHLNQTFSGEETPDPTITNTFYNAETIMPNVVCLGKTPGLVIFMKVIVWKAVQMAELVFDHTSAEYILLVPSLSPFCLFFVACHFLGESLPPPPRTKIPSSAPARLTCISVDVWIKIK